MLMENLLIHANNSLVIQSFEAKKRDKPLNGDGFGIGWYPWHDDPSPGTFVSVEPAWSNRNLRQLSAKIKSHCFFAHVRDASIGMPVSQANCHPFQFGNYLWMHNGRLDQFDKIKRPLINTLSDQAFHFIQGSTDSEHAFALFLDRIKFNIHADSGEITNALIATIRHIMELRQANGATTNATMNFGVTDGRTTAVTRFASKSGAKPASLFYAQGRIGETKSGDFRMLPADNDDQESLIIASEPLNDIRSDWTEVKPNHLVVLNAKRDLLVEPIPLPGQDEIRGGA